MKKTTFLAFALVMSTLANVSFAQVIGDVDPGQYNDSPCVIITQTMTVGSKDSTTSGEVSTLQSYLAKTGFMTSEATGYFGYVTKQAVKNFQSANGLLSSGYVGPYTKAKVQSLSCGGYTPSPVPTNPIACTMEARTCADGSLMPRNPNTCEWLPSQCGNPVAPTPVTPSCGSGYIWNGANCTSPSPCDLYTLDPSHPNCNPTYPPIDNTPGYINCTYSVDGCNGTTSTYPSTFWNNTGSSDPYFQPCTYTTDGTYICSQ